MVAFAALQPGRIAAAWHGILHSCATAPVICAGVRLGRGRGGNHYQGLCVPVAASWHRWHGVRPAQHGCMVWVVVRYGVCRERCEEWVVMLLVPMRVLVRRLYSTAPGVLCMRAADLSWCAVCWPLCRLCPPLCRLQGLMPQTAALGVFDCLCLCLCCASLRCHRALAGSRHVGHTAVLQARGM